MLATFLQWQSTVDYLFDLSKNVVPVPQRKNVIIDELTVTSLAAYSNEEVFYFYIIYHLLIILLMFLTLFFLVYAGYKSIIVR